MNKKGQVLVAFVLILPLLLMFSTLIVDVGYLYIEKRNVDNNVKDAIEYGLKNIDEDNIYLKNKIENQIKLNIDDIEVLKVNIENSIIEIELVKRKNSIFAYIFSNTKYEVSTHYRGYIDKEKFILRKV